MNNNLLLVAAIAVSVTFSIYRYDARLRAEMQIMADSADVIAQQLEDQEIVNHFLRDELTHAIEETDSALARADRAEAFTRDVLDRPVIDTVTVIVSDSTEAQAVADLIAGRDLMWEGIIEDKDEVIARFMDAERRWIDREAGLVRQVELLSEALDLEVERREAAEALARRRSWLGGSLAVVVAVATAIIVR